MSLFHHVETNKCLTIGEDINMNGVSGVVPEKSSESSTGEKRFKYLRLTNDGSSTRYFSLGEVEVYVGGVNICRDSEHGYDSLDMTDRPSYSSYNDGGPHRAVDNNTNYSAVTSAVPGYWLIEFTNSYLLSDIESVVVKVWSAVSWAVYNTRGVQIEFMNSSQTIINNTVRIPDDQNGDYTHTLFTLIDSLDLSAASPPSEPVSYFNHFLEQAQQSPYLDISVAEIEVAETEVIECVSLNTIVNVVSSNGNKYVFNNSNSYTEGLVYGVYDGSYTFTDISENHPMAILNDGKSDFISYTGDADKKFTKDVDGVSYDFYYGDMSVSISGDFDVVSIYCYYHGYMGGENLLTYDISCEQIPTTSSSAETEYEQYYITHTIPHTVGPYNHSNFAASLAMNRAGDAIFMANPGSGRHYQNFTFALVYKQVSGVWSQRGNMMTIMNGANNFGGTYGFSKAIFSDDGDTIAISYAVNQVLVTNTNNNYGDIRVITYDSSSDTWVFKGNYVDNAEISTSHQTNGQIFSMGTDGTSNAATGARLIGRSSFDLNSDGSIIAIYSRSSSSNLPNSDIIIYKYENTYTSSWDTIGTISTTRNAGGLSMNSDGTRVAFSNGATDFIEVWEYVSDNNWVKTVSYTHLTLPTKA